MAEPKKGPLRARSLSRHTSGGVRLVVILSGLGLGGCLWESFGAGCDTESEPLEYGEAVDGVSPDEVFAPIFEEHVGTLTWTATGETTPMTVTVTREGSAVYVSEYCTSDRTSHEFRIYASVSAVSGDGLINNSESLFNLELDQSGAIRPIDEFAVHLGYTELREAGLGIPGLYGTADGPRGTIVFDPETLTPQDFALVMGYPQDDDEYLIAQIAFE